MSSERELWADGAQATAKLYEHLSRREWTEGLEELHRELTRSATSSHADKYGDSLRVLEELIRFEQHRDQVLASVTEVRLRSPKDRYYKQIIRKLQATRLL